MTSLQYRQPNLRYTVIGDRRPGGLTHGTSTLGGLNEAQAKRIDAAGKKADIQSARTRGRIETTGVGGVATGLSTDRRRS